MAKIVSKIDFPMMERFSGLSRAQLSRHGHLGHIEKGWVGGHGDSLDQANLGDHLQERE